MNRLIGPWILGVVLALVLAAPLQARAATPTVVTGAVHSCALSAGGNVFCWGANSRGQLGNGTTISSSMPVAVAGPGGVGLLSGVTGIAAGPTGSHTCAATGAGAVYCWGANTSGQLGNNSVIDSPVPVQVVDTTGAAFLGAALSVAAGLDNSCAIVTGGVTGNLAVATGLLCWGSDAGAKSFGGSALPNQLTPRTSNRFSTCVGVAGCTPSFGGNGSDNVYPVSVQLGDTVTCALLSDTAVHCWGDRTGNSVGANNLLWYYPFYYGALDPTNNFIYGVSSFSTEGSTTCAVAPGARLVCWGGGTNPSINLAMPVVQVAMAPRAVGAPIAACGVDTAGVVSCSDAAYLPTALSGSGALSGVKFLTDYSNHACALMTDGSVTCWGSNPNGEFGNGATNATKVLTPVPTLGPAGAGPLRLGPAQTIFFSAVPSLSLGGTATLTALPAGGSSANAVVLSSLTPLVCAVSGNTVTAVGAGTCTIAANQAGDANYTAAPQMTQTLTVAQGTQVIAFPAIPDQALPPKAISLSATGGLSGNPMVYSSLTTSVCAIGGANLDQVAIFTNGVCTIAANQAGNANYLAAAQVTRSFNVGTPQPISFVLPPTVLLSASPLVLAATGGASGNPVTFSATTPAVCLTGGVNGTSLVLFGTGTCTVVAQQAGTVFYLPASVTQSFQVIVGYPQAITFAGPTDSLLAASPLTLVASGGASGNPVSYSSTTPAVCTTGGSNGSSLSLLSPGSCSVVANQAGSATYLAAPPVTRTFNVLQNPQFITFGALPGKLPTDLPFTISATGGGSGNPVVFTSSTLAVCVTGGLNGTTVVLFGGTGTCTITASQAGNGNYLAAAPVVRSFSVAAPAAPTSNSGDIPLPPWAYALLAAGLGGALWLGRRSGAEGSRAA